MANPLSVLPPNFQQSLTRRKTRMFELPSMWNLIISTIIFFVAAWYIHRYLDENGIPKGATRGLAVFVLASVVSWGAGEVTDWIHDKIEGPAPKSQTQADLSQLLKAVGQTPQ
jgi:4-amino-4-deoxy-L-arabinose transferase-like glycosyltransferase